MSPLDVTRALPIASAAELDRWLGEHGATERELVIAISKKASGKQTVTFDELLETAMCHGWVDTQSKSIDDERYALRYAPRRPGSNWSPRNRELARQLQHEGRLTAAGVASLPLDL